MEIINGDFTKAESHLKEAKQINPHVVVELIRDLHLPPPPHMISGELPRLY